MYLMVTESVLVEMALVGEWLFSPRQWVATHFLDSLLVDWSQTQHDVISCVVLHSLLLLSGEQ